MAVLPAFQRRAIGSKLIRAGLDACRLENTDAVFVLGHKEYYPRFGFEPVVTYGLHYREPKLDTYFFVMELKPGMLAGLSGTVSYHPLFETV
jgi:putative acetyltransferase